MFRNSRVLRAITLGATIPKVGSTIAGRSMILILVVPWARVNLEMSIWPEKSGPNTSWPWRCFSSHNCRRLRSSINFDERLKFRAICDTNIFYVCSAISTMKLESIWSWSTLLVAKCTSTCRNSPLADSARHSPPLTFNRWLRPFNIVIPWKWVAFLDSFPCWRSMIFTCGILRVGDTSWYQTWELAPGCKGAP